MHVEGVIGRAQQALESLEGHLHQIRPGVLEVDTWDECGGTVHRKAVGARPRVVGQGLCQGVVGELGHFERHVVAQARCPCGLDGHRGADAGLDFQHGDLLHRTAVLVHQGAGAVVRLVVARDVARAVDVGLCGERAVALQEHAVVGQGDLVFVGDAVHAQWVVVQLSPLGAVGAGPHAYTHHLVCLDELARIVPDGVGHVHHRVGGHPLQAAFHKRGADVQGGGGVDVHGGVAAQVFAHDGVFQDVARLGHAAVEVFDVDGGPEVGLVHVDDRGDDLHGDGFASGGHPDFRFGGVVGQEVVAAVVGDKHAGVVAQRVVERRHAPRRHRAVVRVGAVERVGFVVGGVRDVFKPAAAVEPQPVAAFTSVAVVRHHAELQVNGTKGRGEEAGNGHVHRGIVSAAAHGDHGEAVEHRQVAHGFQRILVHHDQHPAAPRPVVLGGHDVGDGVPRVDGVVFHPRRHVGEAAIVVDPRSVKLPFLVGQDVEVRLVVAGLDLHLVSQVFVGHTAVAQPTCPVQPSPAHLGAHAQGQAVGRRAPRVGVVVPVVVLHVVAVVVVGGPSEGCGALGRHAGRSGAAKHGGVGQKLNAPILLGLKADVEVVHHLGMPLRRKRCASAGQGPTEP